MKLTSILLVALFSIGNFTFSNQIAKKEKVSFKINIGFSTVHGQFNQVDFSITQNEDVLESISGKVEISSISTGNTKRDKHLQDEAWFDSPNYPIINVHSTKIIKNKEGRYLGTFEIHIKGKTEVYEIPFQILNNGTHNTFKAAFHLSKATFDIGSGFVDLLVGDKVSLNIEIQYSI